MGSLWTASTQWTRKLPTQAGCRAEVLGSGPPVLPVPWACRAAEGPLFLGGRRLLVSLSPRASCLSSSLVMAHQAAPTSTEITFYKCSDSSRRETPFCVYTTNSERKTLHDQKMNCYSHFFHVLWVRLAYLVVVSKTQKPRVTEASAWSGGMSLHHERGILSAPVTSAT